jgi:hypothetical protein
LGKNPSPRQRMRNLVKHIKERSKKYPEYSKVREYH